MVQRAGRENLEVHFRSFARLATFMLSMASHARRLPVHARSGHMARLPHPSPEAARRMPCVEVLAGILGPNLPIRSFSARSNRVSAMVAKRNAPVFLD